MAIRPVDFLIRPYQESAVETLWFHVGLNVRIVVIVATVNVLRQPARFSIEADALFN